MYSILWLKLVYILSNTIVCLLSVVFVTLIERKVIGSIHLRKRTSKTLWGGLVQRLSDGVKLLTSSTIVPESRIFKIYTVSRVIAITLLFIRWSCLPFGINLVGFYLSFIVVFVIISLNRYPIIIIGWSRGTKYRLLGRIRRISQLIRYEIVIILGFLPWVIISTSFNIYDINEFWKGSVSIIMRGYITTIIVVRCIRELNRTPFDISEGERELTRGFNTEYTRLFFTLLFIMEYRIILLVGVVFIYTNINMHDWIYLELTLWVWFVVILRCVLPRIQYDNSIHFMWKYVLPVRLVGLLFMLWV